MEQDLNALAPSMECAEAFCETGELLEGTLELKGSLGNTVRVAGAELARKCRKQVGPKRLDVAMSVQLVRVGVHGDEVRVIRLEGPNNHVLQD